MAGLPTRAQRVIRSIRQAIPTGVVLGRRSLGAGPAEFIPLSEIQQAQLDAISSTQGSILYRGASAWAALAPGTSGHFLKTNGAAANPEWAASGGGSGRWFRGMAGLGSAPTIDVGARATKGTSITPRFDMTIDSVDALLDQAATGDNYYAIIAELSDASATATVSSVLATTTPQSNGTTNPHIDRFPLSSPVDLTAGSHYFIGLVFSQASGTAVCRAGRNSATGITNIIMMAPVTQNRSMEYNTVGLSVAQAPTTTFPDVMYCAFPEGTYTP